MHEQDRFDYSWEYREYVKMKCKYEPINRYAKSVPGAAMPWDVAARGWAEGVNVGIDGGGWFPLDDMEVTGKCSQKPAVKAAPSAVQADVPNTAAAVKANTTAAAAKANIAGAEEAECKDVAAAQPANAVTEYQTSKPAVSNGGSDAFESNANGRSDAVIKATKPKAADAAQVELAETLVAENKQKQPLAKKNCQCCCLS